MKKSIKMSLVLCLLLLVGCAHQKNDHKIFESHTLQKHRDFDITPYLQKLNLKPDEVLLVYDLDNTLLTLQNHIGSDAWWEQQSKNCLTKTPPPYCLTSDFQKLLRYQGVLLHLSPMKSVEPGLADLIQQRSSYDQMILTSRGPQFFPFSQRELENNKISLPNSPGLNECRYQVKMKRETQYLDGLFHTSGLPKGEALENLLSSIQNHQHCSQKTNYKLIIFFDDHQRNLKKMEAVFRGKTHLVVNHYVGAKEMVKNFQKLKTQKFKSFNQSLKNMEEELIKTAR